MLDQTIPRQIQKSTEQYFENTQLLFHGSSQERRTEEEYDNDDETQHA